MNCPCFTPENCHFAACNPNRSWKGVGRLLKPESYPLPPNASESEDSESSQTEWEIEVDDKPQAPPLLSRTKIPTRQWVTSPPGSCQPRGDQAKPCVRAVAVAPGDSLLTHDSIDQLVDMVCATVITSTHPRPTDCHRISVPKWAR